MGPGGKHGRRDRRDILWRSTEDGAAAAYAAEPGSPELLVEEVLRCRGKAVPGVIYGKLLDFGRKDV
jgi:hypothetical protein